jgi:hypothetical protein
VGIYARFVKKMADSSQLIGSLTEIKKIVEEREKLISNFHHYSQLGLTTIESHRKQCATRPRKLKAVEGLGTI